MATNPFNFDRVAKIYSAQRAHPRAVAQAIGRAIADQAGPGARVVEIGVGTGLIAWTVAEAGCRVVGLDISRPMLDEVPGTRPPDLPPTFPATLPLTEADMHHLPFADECADAVLMVRVLHLAHDWRQVLDEVTRVLRPGGCFIIGNNWWAPDSVTGRLRHEMRMAVLEADPTMQPPAAGAAVAQYLAQRGATGYHELVAAEWTETVVPAEMLAGMATRADSESWVLSDELLEPVMERLYRKSAEWWPDLNAPQPVLRRFTLQVTRGHWGADSPPRAGAILGSTKPVQVAHARAPGG